MVIEEASPALTTWRSVMRQSKIKVPPVNGVSRPRLVARMNAATEARLVVVSAPAGWGKTTLVAEWAQQADLPVAWVSIDEADNDPFLFFQAVASALAHIHPMRLDDVLVMLRSPELVGERAIDEAILSAIEDLPGPTAIVLDDFHLLTGPEQMRSLARVVERMPSWVHIVVTTRGEVRLPLARLRAAGAVASIRVTDLAFTIDETRELLRERGLPVGADEVVEQLVERTEGWVVGLRLASLTALNDLAAGRLRGTLPDISSYFREEVLNYLDADRHRFLVETSVLDQVCAGLAAEVTQIPGSQTWLHEENADVFLTPLDAEHRWYRYHPLFRDVLREEFSQLPWPRQSEVHRRASEWFERNGQMVEAIDHALQACETGRAESLIAAAADSLMFTCGRATQLVEWIDQLPEDSMRNGDILRVQAWALTSLGRLDQADRLLQRALNVDNLDPESQGLLLAVQARLAAYRGNHAATITFGEQASALLDPLRQPRVAGDILLSMGFAWWSLGELDQATEAFAEAARLGRLHGNDQAARWGSRYGALARLAQGRLREAEAIVEEDLARLDSSQETSATRAALLVTRGEIQIERGDFAGARASLDEALPVVQREADAKTLMNAYAALGILYALEGNFEAATEKTRRAEDVFPQTIRGWRQARLDLLQGNLLAAERWARRSGFTVDDAADLTRGEDEQLTFARIMAQTDPSLATLSLLDRLLDEAEAGGRYFRALQVLLLQAVVQQRLGNEAAAQAALCRAIAGARIEGFVKVFLSQGADLAPMLRDLLRGREMSDIDRQFVRDILARMSSSVDPVEPSVQALPESLTSRQLEILRLVAAGQSNRAIAEALFISEGTVKAHVHQITGKLLARNRTEAVATARSLQLI